MLLRWLKKLQKTIYRYFERVLFRPKKVDYLVITPLIPLSLIYGTIQLIRRALVTPKEFGIKIISIGNILVGGTGKTPFAIELINYLSSKDKKLKIFYISRGYGRASKGLIVVKDGDILVDVKSSGDEAMLVAKKANCGVIVSEDRVKAIEVAKSKGADLIILDDGFSKVNIKKFDILLEPKEIRNYFPLPAGGFREFPFIKRFSSLILKEGRDFNRLVEVSEPLIKKRVILVTSISKPERLEKYIPKDAILVDRLYLKDHSYFTKEDIKEIEKRLKRGVAEVVVMSEKDYIKLDEFKFKIALLKLKLQINLDIFKKIEEYIYEKKDGDSSDPT